MGRSRNYKREDDRETSEYRTHSTLVIGTDTFFSGWGEAAEGASIAAWACQEADLARVLAWVKSRSDMKRIQVETDKGGLFMYRPPQGTAHFHIYVVRPGHPALSGVPA